MGGNTEKKYGAKVQAGAMDRNAMQRRREYKEERHLCCTGLRGPPPPIQKAAAEITTFSYFVKTFQLFKLSTPISKRAADARINLSVFDSVANCWKSLPGRSLTFHFDSVKFKYDSVKFKYQFLIKTLCSASFS